MEFQLGQAMTAGTEVTGRDSTLRCADEPSLVYSVRSIYRATLLYM